MVVKKTPRERPRRSPAAGVRAIESLLDMLPDAQYQWRHFKEYFGLLYEFGALGAEEREWLLSRNTVMRYIDFYLGDESPIAADAPAHRPKRPRMGDKFAAPQLDEFAKLLSLLARSCERAEPPLASSLSLPGPQLRMSVTELELLTHPLVLGRLLKEQVEPKAVCEIAVHFAEENNQGTNTAMMAALHGVDTMDHDALHPYLKLFCDLMRLKDNLAEWRVNHGMARFVRVVQDNIRYKNCTIIALRCLATLADVARVRQWMLAHAKVWLSHWLMGALSDGCRASVEHMALEMLKAELAAETADAQAEAAEIREQELAFQAADMAAQMAAAGVPVSDDGDADVIADAMAEARAEAAGEAVELQGSEVEVRSELISEVYTQLLLLLPHAVDVARDYQAGTGIERVRAASDKLSSDDVGRLAPFYRVCAWCARHADVPPPTEPPPGQRAFDPFNCLYQAYVAQDTLHVECDETKKAMLELWYRAAKRGGAGSPPLTVFARGGDDRNWVLTRLIESFISLKPNNEKFVAYNRYTLPHFYGLVELAVAADEPLSVLRGSKNFWFAIKQFLVDSSTYTFEPHVEAPRVAGPAAPPAAAAPAAAPMGPRAAARLHRLLRAVRRPARRRTRARARAGAGRRARAGAGARAGGARRRRPRDGARQDPVRPREAMRRARARRRRVPPEAADHGAHVEEVLRKGGAPAAGRGAAADLHR